MYLDRFKLTDRVAVVTGGARGIGLCTAEALAEAGARVTIWDRDAAELEAATASLAAQGCTRSAPPWSRSPTRPP